MEFLLQQRRVGREYSRAARSKGYSSNKVSSGRRPLFAKFLDSVYKLLHDRDHYDATVSNQYEEFVVKKSDKASPNEGAEIFI